MYLLVDILPIINTVLALKITALWGAKSRPVIYQAARSHAPEDVSHHSHSCDSLKCRMLFGAYGDNMMILFYNE